MKRATPPTILILACAVYRSRSGAVGLNVEPHAAEEIDKAKRR